MQNNLFGAFRTLGILLLLAVVALAQPRNAMAQDAQSFISKLGTEAIQVLGPQVPVAQRTARFRQLFENDFDLQGASRFVLGPYANGLNPQQHQEFVALFTDYLAQAYAARLAEYAGEPFRVTGSRPNGQETIVTSQVTRRGGQPVEIDWHVADRGGRPLVTDVYVDGVSMKVTHRQEFASIIQRNGGRPDALLAALRQQLAQSGTARTGSSSPVPGRQEPMTAPGQPYPGR